MITEPQLDPLESELITSTGKSFDEAMKAYIDNMLNNGNFYGNLAYQACKVDSLKGKVIRSYLELMFQASNRELTDTLLDKLTHQLIKAHIDFTRGYTKSSLTLEMIQNYHMEVFNKFSGLPKEAWKNTVFFQPFSRILWSMNKELIPDSVSNKRLSSNSTHYEEVKQFLETLFYKDLLLQKAFLSLNVEELLPFFLKLTDLFSKSPELSSQWKETITKRGNSQFIQSLLKKCFDEIDSKQIIALNASDQYQLIELLMNNPIVFPIENYLALSKEIKDEKADNRIKLSMVENPMQQVIGLLDNSTPTLKLPLETDISTGPSLTISNLSFFSATTTSTSPSIMSTQTLNING